MIYQLHKVVMAGKLLLQQHISKPQFQLPSGHPSTLDATVLEAPQTDCYHRFVGQQKQISNPLHFLLTSTMTGVVIVNMTWDKR